MLFAGAGVLTVQKVDTFRLAWQEGREIAAMLWGRSHPPGSIASSNLMRSTYAMFLSAHGFQNIPLSVVLAPHSNRRGAIQNMLPPESLWKNILPTLRVADRLAEELGEKIYINSAYRSPEYNAACPGAAKWSQHLRNNALDIRFKSPSVEVARMARALRDAGLFCGGVGLYANFTHIDARGSSRDW